MRIITLPAATLLGAALLVPMGTVSAAAETCEGQPATIVGSPGGQIVGTEGADVIVTNGATRVDALGGDDLVCATGDRGTVAVLGAGADTFIDSNGQSHQVIAGTLSGVDTEADVIRISRYSRVSTGMAGQPNADTIDLALTGYVHWSGIQTAPGSVSVGMGGGLFLRSASDVTVDASGIVTGADTSLTFAGHFDEFEFTTPSEYGRFTFRGTDGIEHVKVGAPTTYDRDVTLGGGNDTYESNGLGGKGSRIKGNGGRDHLLLDLYGHRVRAELHRSRVIATKAGVESTVRVRGFEDLTVSSKRANVTGTNSANYIEVIACRAHIKGKKGKDHIYANVEYLDGDEWASPRCRNYRAVVFGGRGADVIRGGPGNDRLIGGRGKDRVNGEYGRDVCQGWKVVKCERRL